MIVLAKRGKSTYLVAEAAHAAVGKVIDLEYHEAFPEFNVHSILARGYWEDAGHVDDAVLKALCMLSGYRE